MTISSLLSGILCISVVTRNLDTFDTRYIRIAEYQPVRDAAGCETLIPRKYATSRYLTGTFVPAPARQRAADFEVINIRICTELFDQNYSKGFDDMLNCMSFMHAVGFFNDFNDERIIIWNFLTPALKY
ncbi:hypothetical protein PUN28_011620 [Cardiocondyla obscurior]|uniref:Uncharacterized protein n=1 Tax=Cardiocondyla obscurior TaxID=286306 RepID=A0AAW2FIJ9_9HYME